MDALQGNDVLQYEEPAMKTSKNTAWNLAALAAVGLSLLLPAIPARADTVLRPPAVNKPANSDDATQLTGTAGKTKYNHARHGQRSPSRTDKYRFYYDGYWYDSPWWSKEAAATVTNYNKSTGDDDDDDDDDVDD